MVTLKHDLLKNVPLFLYSIAVILHSIGITLLLRVRRKRNQDFIILHLSVSELCMSILDITQNILSRDRYANQSATVPYVIIVNCCFFTVPSFLIIITLTIDRFFEVYLNIKYQLFFSKKKLRIILLASWALGAFVGVIMITLKTTQGTCVRLLIFMVVFPVLEGAFLITATITYAYIYKKFRRKFKRHFLGKVAPKIRPMADDNDNKGGQSSSTATVETTINAPQQKQTPTRKMSLWKTRLGGAKRVVLILGSNKSRDAAVFKRRNFFAPSLILFTFVLFVVIPDTLNLIFNYAKLITWSEDISNMLLCLYSIGFIVDGLIYIFLQKHLRNMLLKIFFHRKWVQEVTMTSYCENSH